MIEKAEAIKGWMNTEELLWLSEQARRHKTIVEIGSHLGRSTRALADNTEGIVYAIDNWRGPQSWEISETEREELYRKFLSNVGDLIESGKVIPLRMDHRNLTLDVVPDMVFIDGSHLYPNVKADIEYWMKRLPKGTLLCGHDSNFRDVRQALIETLGVIQVIPLTYIWYYVMGQTKLATPVEVPKKPVFLTIGVPHTGLIHADTVITLCGLIGRSEWPTHTVLQRGCYVHENREKIVKEAQVTGSSHVLFLDADMWLPEGTLPKLLLHDKDIIGVSYNQREFPLISTVKYADNKGKLIAKTGAELSKLLHKCFSVGTGCMLVKLAVFDKIDKPWFWFERIKGDIMGEDVWFCRQAHKKGFDVWVDPTIEVKHIGDYAY